MSANLNYNVVRDGIEAEVEERARRGGALEK